MSTGIDLQFVRETYQRMSDEELAAVVTQRMEGLTPEATAIVKEEIKRRGLHDGLTNSIDAQQRTFSHNEINAYCELIQNLPCPVTGNTSTRLNATLVAEAAAFIFFSHYRTHIVIASPEVLRKENGKAMIKAALFGWWDFFGGIPKTIRALAVNARNRKTDYQQGPTEYLRNFVLSRIGEIEAYKHDKDQLCRIINNTN